MLLFDESIAFFGENVLVNQNHAYIGIPRANVNDVIQGAVFDYRKLQNTKTWKIHRSPVAPVIVDPDQDEVYFTPLYYTMAHFSKYVRPGAKRIDFESTDKELQVTAATNPDGHHVVIVFNPSEEEKIFNLQLGEATKTISISPQAIQTIKIIN